MLNKESFIGLSVSTYGQKATVIDIEYRYKANERTYKDVVLHLDKPVVVPTKDYTKDIMFFNEVEFDNESIVSLSKDMVAEMSSNAIHHYAGKILSTTTFVLECKDRWETSNVAAECISNAIFMHILYNKSYDNIDADTNILDFKPITDFTLADSEEYLVELVEEIALSITRVNMPGISALLVAYVSWVDAFCRFKNVSIPSIKNNIITKVLSGMSLD